MVNAYWEANMPKTMRKLDSNASNQEVTQFMTNKYVHKKWASDDWNNDPAWLFENKQKKFAKYVKYYQEKVGAVVEEPSSKPSGGWNDSSDDEVPVKKNTAAQKSKAGLGAPPSNSGRVMPKQPVQAAKAPAQDLLDFGSSPAPQ
tara:strand:+ start:461 stop:895 length:435 start_codon:yes stop_codon:yes gene_type:complete